MTLLTALCDLLGLDPISFEQLSKKSAFLADITHAEASSFLIYLDTNWISQQQRSSEATTVLEAIQTANALAHFQVSLVDNLQKDVTHQACRDYLIDYVVYGRKMLTTSAYVAPTPITEAQVEKNICQTFDRLFLLLEQFDSLKLSDTSPRAVVVEDGSLTLCRIHQAAILWQILHSRAKRR